ncbi:RHS repeat-associated core domain-containing protein, partial [Stenotrophomonas acidaminiphila]|uniref:RHS repeat-associated core domain-containing protein n=2 Tax=Stenotrophomonas acidaminiphila TaxID=128780 RepID=UPI0020C63071
RMPIGETVYGTIYRHTDALGSPIAATDELGNTLQTTEHEPYGKMLNRTNDNRPGYTGHMMDKATGLVYMQQRYYDPLIPRFLSVDPITAYSNPVGAFNRYWYANNNPYKYTDPDGRNAVSDWLVRNGFLPHGPSVYTPIPGASRGDAQVVSLIAGSAVAGGLAAAAVTVGAPAMISAAAESASLGTGMAAQQTANLVTGAVAATTEAASMAAVGATVRTMVAVDAEVSMVATYAGANATAASSQGLAAAVATPAAATEFAAGVLAGAAGITSPASSLANAAGGSLGSTMREDLKLDKK